MKFLPVLACLAACFLAACATKSSSELPVALEARFRKADRDGDGKVSRKEFTDFMIADAFVLYDKDGKGYVTLEEFVEGGGSPQLFKKIDVTGKGSFTLAEAQASKVVRDAMVKPFDEADTDHSGYVTLADFLAARQKAQSFVR